MLQQIAGRMAAHRDAMVDLTTRLVASTENPPGNRYRECAEFLCEELTQLGFEDTRLEGDCVLSSAGEGATVATICVGTSVCEMPGCDAFAHTFVMRITRVELTPGGSIGTVRRSESGPVCWPLKTFGWVR